LKHKSEFELLRELAELLRRYGPETFEKLATEISSPHFSKMLGSMLSSVAMAGRHAQISRSEQKKSRRKLEGGIPSILVQLRTTEPEKSTLLARFYDSLSAKAVLPTLREIQEFAADAGLPRLKATAREKAITPLLKGLMSLPVKEMRDRLALLKPVSKEDDRSLEGWTNIILGSEMRR